METEGDFPPDRPLLEDGEGSRRGSRDYAGEARDRIIVPLLNMEEGFCRKMGVVIVILGIFSILLEFVWTPRIGPTRAIGLCLLSLGAMAVGIILYFYKHSVQMYVRITESGNYMRIAFVMVIGTLFVCITFATFMILNCYVCAAIGGSVGLFNVLVIGACYKLCHCSDAEDWPHLFGKPKARERGVKYVATETTSSIPQPPPSPETNPTMEDVKNMKFTVEDEGDQNRNY